MTILLNNTCSGSSFISTKTCSNSNGGSGGSVVSKAQYYCYYYIILLQDSIYVCCIGALIIHILNSLHQEVVRYIKVFSSNHRILYNIYKYYQYTTIHLQLQLHHYTHHLPNIPII